MMTYLRRRRIKAAILVAAVLIFGLIIWRLTSRPGLYRVTILPSLGGQMVRVSALNDRGQVVGWELVGRSTHLFLWDRDGGIQDLGPVAGAPPLRINNAGQICGTAFTSAGNVQAFLWEGGKGRTLLGTLGGPQSIAAAMNSRGQIIGTCSDPAAEPGYTSRAFLWDPAEGMRELKAPDGRPCEALSINDAGRVLASVLGANDAERWLLFDPNEPVSLNPVPPYTRPHAVNNGSCVAAVENRSGPDPWLVLRDERGTWTRLTRIGIRAKVTRLNDRNQIAWTQPARNAWSDMGNRLFRRRSTSGGTQSYLWDPARGRIPLNRYVPGMRRLQVRDLNNEGCIAGTAEMRDGSTRSVLLEPIPERWKGRKSEGP